MSAADTEERVDVVLLDEREVLTSFGRRLPITMFVDEDDFECDSEDAAACIVEVDGAELYVGISPKPTVH